MFTTISLYFFIFLVALWKMILKNSNLHFTILFIFLEIMNNYYNEFCQAVQCAKSKISNLFVVLRHPHRLQKNIYVFFSSEYFQFCQTLRICFKVLTKFDSYRCDPFNADVIILLWLNTSTCHKTRYKICRGFVIAKTFSG